MKLLVKILLWMFPVALPVMGFTWSYYQAQLEASAEQTGNIGSLVATSGAQRLNDFLLLRASEFSLLGSGMEHCKESELQQNIVLQARNALQQSRGFSALVISDENNRVVTSQIAATPSNRFILPRSLGDSSFFSASEFSELKKHFNEWEMSLPELRRKKSALFFKAMQLEARGEINSELYQGIQSQLFNLTRRINQPPIQVRYNGGKEAQMMGLPFKRDTFLFTQPLVDCDSHLEGYVTAFMDHTQLEDILYDLRLSLSEKGFQQLDITLLQMDAMSFLTEPRLVTEIESQALRDSLTMVGYQKKIGGFLAAQPVLDSQLLTRLLSQVNSTDDNLSQNSYQELLKQQSTIVLLVYIADDEWQARGSQLLLEVSVWLILSMLLLFVLVFLLARNIVDPIVQLKRSLKKVEAGDLSVQAEVNSADEVGELARAFNKMTAALHRSESELKRLAREDDLTGLLNRRALLDEAIRERHRASRGEYDIAVVLLDLDHFKLVNDRYGHSAGDTVLKQFAGILRRHLRKTDIISRVGGEEFVLLLPDTDIGNAYQLLEQLRVDVSEMPIELDSGAVVHITFSAGLGIWGEAFGFEEALHQVDDKMYLAKQAGRNCVIR